MSYYYGYFAKPSAEYARYSDAHDLPVCKLPAELPADLSPFQEKDREVHWVVEALGEPYCSLHEHRELLSHEWNKIQKTNLPTDSTPYAALHLRRGDFRIAGLAEDLDKTSEFIEQFLQDSRGLRPLLMTDADPRDREFWDSVPSELEFNRSRNALEDLRVMMGASLLYGTAQSSYSRCAAYFGGMQTKWLGDLPAGFSDVPISEPVDCL